MSPAPVVATAQKDNSQVRQKEMIARHFDRLAAAPETGALTAYTFVPGNLTELLLSFEVLPGSSPMALFTSCKITGPSGQPRDVSVMVTRTSPLSATSMS